jgi:MFS family permease
MKDQIVEYAAEAVSSPMSAEPTTPQPTASVRLKVLLAAGIGNFIEWYGFIVYGFLAPILAPLFFPSDDLVTSLLATFAVFGVGFGLRPVGGLILGHLGDRYGRRNALVLVIALMAVGTTMFGVAPSYAQAGIIGPIVLVLARALQGFAIGGEFASSSTFMVEYAPPGQRGRYGGWQMFSQMAGLLAGAVVAGVLTVLLAPEAAREWGWRVAFLLAVPLIGVALYVRLQDTPVFKRVESTAGAERLPILASLRRGWRCLLTMVGILCLPAIGVYALFVSMPAYLVATQGLPLKTGLISTIIGLAVFTTAAIPPAGGVERLHRTTPAASRRHTGNGRPGLSGISGDRYRFCGHDRRRAVGDGAHSCPRACSDAIGDGRSVRDTHWSQLHRYRVRGRDGAVQWHCPFRDHVAELSHRRRSDTGCSGGRRGGSHRWVHPRPAGDAPCGTPGLTGCGGTS